MMLYNILMSRVGVMVGYPNPTVAFVEGPTSEVVWPTNWDESNWYLKSLLQWPFRLSRGDSDVYGRLSNSRVRNVDDRQLSTYATTLARLDIGSWTEDCPAKQGWKNRRDAVLETSCRMSNQLKNTVPSICWISRKHVGLTNSHAVILFGHLIAHAG